MGCIHFESSSDQWTRSVQDEEETSNTVSPQHEQGGGGIQEAWDEIETRRGGFFAGENKNKLEKRKSQVLLEGYVVEAADQEDLTRGKSLTDDDLEELKGCLDLGFGFSYDEIPELCNTLPALELCYSMSQKFLDDKQNQMCPAEEDSQPPLTTTNPVANWKISSPGT